MEQLEIKTGIQIARPQKDIFEAIVGPEEMSNYFISHGTARMEEGETIEWTFPEFPERFPVKVLQIKPFQNVIFEWDGSDTFKTTVEVNLKKITDSQTLVKITEGKMEVNEQGIKWYGQNTEGWANFLACLKAYMEHGINLRNGAFDYMKK